MELEPRCLPSIKVIYVVDVWNTTPCNTCIDRFFSNLTFFFNYTCTDHHQISAASDLEKSKASTSFLPGISVEESPRINQKILHKSK